MGKVILTGDRPTGQMHIGHLVGSFRNRVAIQNAGDFDKMLIMVADAQALTDNFDDVNKVRSNIAEVALDYLAVGLDPEKCVIFIQSLVPELTELTFYFMNLVTLSRLERNPTVKTEMRQKGLDTSIPMGFLCYPVSQAADILGFMGTHVPVGEDQLPMIEQTREIARSFNGYYGEVFPEPEAVLPSGELCRRLPGTDGDAKMGKSLGNCIFLADSADELRRKINGMYTDPGHIAVSDPGKVEGNMVFTYLEVFCADEHFSRYLPEYAGLEEMAAHYRRGGLGDVKCKKFLTSVMEEVLSPIRDRRAEFGKRPDYVTEMLKTGSVKAREEAARTLDKVRHAMGIDYFG